MLFPVPPIHFASLRLPRERCTAGSQRRRTVLWALASGCLLIVGCLAARGQQPDEVDLSKAEQVILEQTNQFRQQQGLEPLQRQEALQEAAKQFARFMSENDAYGHTADGRTPAERAEAAGYAYCIVRENIAYVTDTGDNRAQPLAGKLVQGWKDSPEHRRSMLAEGVTEIGVAVATGRGRTFYAVQLFGRPESAAFQLEVVNASDQTVELRADSGDGQDTIELAPRARLRMQRCRPTMLSLGDQRAATEVRQSQKLQIVADADGALAFKPLESES